MVRLSLSYIYIPVPCQSSEFRTPLTLRVNNREWNLPLDSPVNYAVTRVHVLETGNSPIDPSQINVTVARNVNPVGPYHDTSDYFDLYRLPSSNLRNGIQFEVFLSKSLTEPNGKFQAGDQFTLELRAKDTRANHVVKLEIYGRIETARGIPPSPVSPPQSTSTPATTTSSLASQPANNSSATTYTPETSKSVTVYFIAIPLVVIGLSLTAACCFKGKLRQCCAKVCGKKSENKKDVDAVKSNTTEFSELPSRQTSLASTTFFKSDSLSSFNPYEDSLINNTKDEKDRWEFPRHHLKFYGILGKSRNPSIAFLLMVSLL